MKQLWEQLRPNERRMVTVIGVIVFIVLNYFFVWPQFKQYRLNKVRMAAARDVMDKFTPEIQKRKIYEDELKKFDAFDEVPAESQILKFANYYESRAVENGIQILSENQRPPHTNEFSIDQQTTLDVQANEKNLVSFLFSLGSSDSQMRVRDMHLHALEPNRYQLRANLTIVASYPYQKKPASPGARGTPSQAPAQPQPFKPAALNTTNTVYPLNHQPAPATPPATGSRPSGLPAVPGRANASSATNKPAPPKR